MESHDKLYHRLGVYESRLLALKQNPYSESQDILFYEKAIEMIEAEIFAADLAHAGLKPLETETVTVNNWYELDQICKKKYLLILNIKHKWSWRHFKIVWLVEYIPKHM